MTVTVALASIGPAAGLTSRVVREALVPMAAFYLILMGGLGLGLLGLRRRGREPGARRLAARPGRAAAPRGWPALIRHVAGTALGGYLLLMGVVFGYYYGVARVGGSFLSSAVSGAALLIGLALPLFLAGSWLVERRACRRRNRGSEASS